MEGQENETISVQDALGLLVLDANVLEFCRLLAYIESPVVPKALFDRACRPRVVWTESGKLGSVPPDYSKVPDWLVQVFDTREPLEVAPLLQQAVEKGALSITQQDGFLASICLEEKRRNTLRIESSQASSLRHLFDILAVVVHAFPETHAELLWEETEAQVWDVVESTILPLLAVSTVGDILVHILPADTTGQINFLQALLSFLSRITAIIGKDIYPSITQLHEDLFAHFLKVSYEAAPLLRDDISRFLFYAPAAVQLSNMLHMQNNERLNAMRVLSRDASLHGLHKDIAGALSWTPLARGKPSAMEILAMGISHGASTVVELFGIFLHNMPPQVVGILGFLAAKQQSFDVARNILESSIADIKDLYSVVSVENLLTGIELVKCYNFLMDEIEGEKLARSLWSEVFGLEGGKMNITSLYQAYLAVVLADSLIGQSKYDDAQQILLEILGCKDVSSEVIVSTSLRLLKMSRRQRAQSPGFDTWHLLESAVGYIEDISDVLKYECVDEAMCHISILDEDPAQIPRAEAAIIALSRISVKHFAGSETSKQNLVRHMCALQQYRTGFKLFSVTGPQLHFSRLIRDGFPSASISFIERIGAANWNRFNRVKELPLRAEIIMDEACHGDGKTIAGRSDGTFTDSALGSSLQTASKRARTQISYQSVGSAIGGSLENFPPMPVPSSKGKSFECPICCKRLRGIVSAAQWEHHVYADLQPYVCILDRCSSRMTTFGSRLEFTNHMYEHQYSNEWICKACQFKQEDLSAVEQHVAKSHPELEVKSTVLSTYLRRDMAEEQCPFCGITPGYRFFGHVCRHLEEVALSILPKEVEWDSGSEEGESDPELSESFCGLCRISGHDITTCSELSYSSPDKIHSAVTQQSGVEKIVPLQFGSFDKDDMHGRNLPASANNPEFGDLDHNGRTVAPIPDILSIFSNSNSGVRSLPFSPPIPNPLPSGSRPEVPVLGSFDYITRHQRPLYEFNYGWDKYFPSMTDLYYDKGWSVETIHQHIQDPATGFTPSLEDVRAKFMKEDPLAFTDAETVWQLRNSRSHLSEGLPPVQNLPDDLGRMISSKPSMLFDLSQPFIQGEALLDAKDPTHFQYFQELTAFQKTNLKSYSFSPELSKQERRVIHTIAEYLCLGHNTLSAGGRHYVQVTKSPNLHGPESMPQRSSMLLGDDKDLRHLIPPLGRSRMTSTGESASSHQPFYLDPLPTAYKDRNNHADPGQQGTVRRAPETSPEEEPCKITTGDRGDYDEEYREIQPGQITPISPANKDRWGPKLLDPFASSRHPSPIQDTSSRQPGDQEPIAMMDRLYIRQGTGGVLDIIDEELQYLPPSKFVGQFRRPRKNAAITIKRPDGTPIDLSNARVFTAPKPVEDNGRKITNAKYCSECNIQFRKAHRWLKHMESHVKVNGGQGIPCRVPGCGNTFFEEQELKDHELRHFTCTVEGCGRQFVSVKERREHHGTHVVETGGG